MHDVSQKRDMRHRWTKTDTGWRHEELAGINRYGYNNRRY